MSSRFRWQISSWNLRYPDGIALLRRCIQKFPDWVVTKYTLTAMNTRWEATQRVMAAKLTRLIHRIAIKLHLLAESCTICSSRSRLPVRKLLYTPSYNRVYQRVSEILNYRITITDIQPVSEKSDCNLAPSNNGTSLFWNNSDIHIKQRCCWVTSSSNPTSFV